MTPVTPHWQGWMGSSSAVAIHHRPKHRDPVHTGERQHKCRTPGHRWPRTGSMRVSTDVVARNSRSRAHLRLESCCTAKQGISSIDGNPWGGDPTEVLEIRGHSMRARPPQMNNTEKTASKHLDRTAKSRYECFLVNWGEQGKSDHLR